MENIYKNLHSNQKIFIYEMLKRGISVEVINEKREIIKTSFQGHEELIIDRDSSIMPYNVSILAGDKYFTKKNLIQHGISVPIGESFLAKDIDYIKRAFKILNCPVVIKPVFGSHGFDVYTNLITEQDVENAIINIINHRGESTRIIIEEYYNAKEYRVFITRNGNYAVLLRDPAHIFGDGIHTIEYLINKENYERMNPRTNALCEILVDEELISYLRKNNLSLNSVPQMGEKIYLRPNSNVAMGGICEDYTDKVHPSVIEIGSKVLKAFPGLPYVGIDFMTNSISDQQNDYSYKIIEINTVPGIHMHYRPAIGQSRNIAKYIVDMIYPETVDMKKETMYEKPIKRF